MNVMRDSDHDGNVVNLELPVAFKTGLAAAQGPCGASCMDTNFRGVHTEGLCFEESGMNHPCAVRRTSSCVAIATVVKPSRFMNFKSSNTRIAPARQTCCW